MPLLSLIATNMCQKVGRCFTKAQPLLYCLWWLIKSIYYEKYYNMVQQDLSCCVHLLPTSPQHMCCIECLWWLGWLLPLWLVEGPWRSCALWLVVGCSSLIGGANELPSEQALDTIKRCARFVGSKPPQGVLIWKTLTQTLRGLRNS